MEGWRDQITAMYTSFEYQDVLQHTLVEIDKKIINEDGINEIMLLGFDRICKITKADYLVFHIGDDEVYLYDECKNYKSVTNKRNITIDKEKATWGTYIDSVTLCYKNNDQNNKLQLLNIKVDGVTSITRQLNIAIMRDVEHGVNELYRILIKQFSMLGDIFKVFDQFCLEIINIFPKLTGNENLKVKHLDIQVAIFESDDKKMLKGVGSSNDDCAGGMIQEGLSISGKIYPMIESNNIETGYHRLKHKELKYIYYLDDPRNSKDYRKVTIDQAQCQLTVPLFREEDNDTYSPFALLNLESDVSGQFQNIHAKSIVYNAVRLASLLDSVWRTSQGRKHIVEGFFRNNDRYISQVLREYEHRSGHALLALSKIKNDLDESTSDLAHITEGVTDTYQLVERDQKVMKNALKGIIDKEQSVSLSKKVESARYFIRDLLEQEEIDFTFENHSVDVICLDNLFPQYLYSLFYNSIDSIIRKKMRLQAFSKEEYDAYKPYIKVVATPIADSRNITFKESKYDSSGKSNIAITDNGDGIEEDKIISLGRYKKSFHGSSGTGLYSFKQYLIFHDSRIYFSSKLHENFTVKFIVNIPSQV